MPQIIVIADQAADTAQPVMFRERVTVSDFESEHFTAQLAERLAWAVGDAAELERHQPGRGRRRFERRVPDTVADDAGDCPSGSPWAGDRLGIGLGIALARRAEADQDAAPRSASVVTTAS